MHVTCALENAELRVEPRAEPLYAELYVELRVEPPSDETILDYIRLYKIVLIYIILQAKKIVKIYLRNWHITLP